MTHISHVAFSLVLAGLAVPAAAQELTDDEVSGFDVGVSLDGVPDVGPAELRLHVERGQSLGLRKGDAFDQLDIATTARVSKGGPYQLVVISVIGVLIGMREDTEDGGADVVVLGDVAAIAPVVGFVDDSGKGDYAFDVPAGSTLLDSFDDGRAPSITIAVAKGKKKKKGEALNFLVCTMSNVLVSSYKGGAGDEPAHVVLTADAVAVSAVRSSDELGAPFDVRGAGSFVGDPSVGFVDGGTGGLFDDVSDGAEQVVSASDVSVTVGDDARAEKTTGRCEVHVVLGVNAWPVMTVCIGACCL